jgi:hypothetical protein
MLLMFRSSFASSKMSLGCVISNCPMEAEILLFSVNWEEWACVILLFLVMELNNRGD